MAIMLLDQEIYEKPKVEPTSPLREFDPLSSRFLGEFEVGS